MTLAKTFSNLLCAVKGGGGGESRIEKEKIERVSEIVCDKDRTRKRRASLIRS